MTAVDRTGEQKLRMVTGRPEENALNMVAVAGRTVQQALRVAAGRTGKKRNNGGGRPNLRTGRQDAGRQKNRK
jgi:hypothetical protein